MPTTHTPGPWKVKEWTYPEPRGKRLVIQNSHDAIAEMYDLWCMDTRTEEQQANARLIAAAPALYAALHVLFEVVDGRLHGVEKIQAITAARAALALANAKEGHP